MSKSNNNVKSLQKMNNYLSEGYILKSVTYFIRLETLMGRSYSSGTTLWRKSAKVRLRYLTFRHKFESTMINLNTIRFLILSNRSNCTSFHSDLMLGVKFYHDTFCTIPVFLSFLRRLRCNL